MISKEKSSKKTKTKPLIYKTPKNSQQSKVPKAEKDIQVSESVPELKP